MARILNREDMPLFMGLIPNELKTHIFFPGTVVAGEAAKGEDGEVPVAGMILTLLKQEEVGIEWLWVEEELRGEGIGEDLLMLAFDIAKADDRTSVTAKIYTGDEEYFADALGATYFMERQFYHKREEDLWIITKKDFAMPNLTRLDRNLYHPFISKKLGSAVANTGAARTIKPLSAVSDEVLMAASGPGAVISRYREDLDRDMSCVCMEGDVVRGACLLLHVKDSYWPIYLRGDCAQTVKQLVYTCFVEGKDILNQGGLVTAVLGGNKKKAFFRELFPKAEPIRVTVLAAEKDVPEKEQKLIKEEAAYWERMEQKERNRPRHFTYVGTEFMDGSYVSAQEGLEQ